MTIAPGAPPAELQSLIAQMKSYPFVGAMRIPLERGANADETVFRIGSAWDGQTPPGVEVIECLPNIFPVKGIATPVTPGDVIQYEALDMFRRPWSQLWEKYFEKGMQRPAEDEVIFNFEN
jgi:hypothetical protein